MLCGEESIEGAKRELLEEVGIDISDARIRYIGRVKKNRKFADIYFAEKEFCLSDCVLQKEEVDEVCLVDGREILNMERCTRNQDMPYTALLKKAIESMN